MNKLFGEITWLEERRTLPWQKHGLRLREAAARWRKEDVAPKVGVVVVGIVRTLSVVFSVAVVDRGLGVHGPKEPQDEHDGPEHHAAEGEGLQAALGRGEEGGRAPGHYEEDPHEDGPVMQRRHGA